MTLCTTTSTKFYYSQKVGVTYAKLRKCEFFMKRVSFLSHIISEEGMTMDSGKDQNKLSWNACASVTDSRSSPGLVGYYQKFIEGFPKIAKPMTDSLGKDKKFN
jgi:hypothetical protein